MNKYQPIKTYLRTYGDTVNHVFDIPFDFSNYMCGIMQITGDVSVPPVRRSRPSKKSLYLCCDMVEQSYIGKVYTPGIKRPILIELPNPTTAGNRDVFIQHILWLKVTSPFIKDIRLYIIDEEGNIPSFVDCDLTCTLLFSPISN